MLDWFIVGVYVAVLVVMSIWIGRRQKSQADYYVAGRKLGVWPVALSILATQCSANSLIGAPAFIALKSNGGLKWLQYEMAVPLAGIAILFLVPVFFRRQITTIYEVVEHRFGVGARTMLSGIFIFSRALGTAVTLYATAVVVAVCLDWPVVGALLFVGAISMLYTTLGGIEADIYSDILQLIVLYMGTIACIVVVISLLGGFPADFGSVSESKRVVLDFAHHGLGDNQEYSFWPMLFGGFFLYVSYYGCDQSQAQRLLSAKNMKTAQKAIVLNGILRFPLVLTYCLFGLLLAVFLARNPAFAESVLQGDANSLVPRFILDYVPVGVRGIIVAGIIAAAMSSLDSAMNSLSAATQRDFLDRFATRFRVLPFRNEVTRARAITIFWGIVCTGLAFAFAGTTRTVLELVNMVGSAVNGPILAIFILTLLNRRVSSGLVVAALLAGVGVNMVLWKMAPGVSWMWWNAIGCIVTFSIVFMASSRLARKERLFSKIPWVMFVLLILAFVVILGFLIWLDN